MNKKQLLTGRRTFLLGMGGFTLTSKLRQESNQISEIQDQNIEIADPELIPLRERAAAKGLIFGAAGKYRELSVNPKLASLYAQECGILVPEVELKWRSLRPSLDRFDFTHSDWLAEFALTHNLLFRGHTLVWHHKGSLPLWFQDRLNHQNAKRELLKHIETVVKYYAGQIHSWDVVNEAIEPTDGRSDGLRKTPWLKFLGSDYIDLAFRVAAEADPQALLVYNDYGLDYDNRKDEAKRTAVLKLLERLKSMGTPVHALGIQAHLLGGATNFNPKKLRDFLSNVASLGLKILITEMDVVDRDLPVNQVIRDRFVAEAYKNYLTVALDEPAVIAVITWGLSDRYTWLSNYRPRSDGAPVRPLPLDADFKSKLAWKAIADAFDNAPSR